MHGLSDKIAEWKNERMHSAIKEDISIRRREKSWNNRKIVDLRLWNAALTNHR